MKSIHSFTSSSTICSMMVVDIYTSHQTRTWGSKWSHEGSNCLNSYFSHAEARPHQTMISTSPRQSSSPATIPLSISRRPTKAPDNPRVSKLPTEPHNTIEPKPMTKPPDYVLEPKSPTESPNKWRLRTTRFPDSCIHLARNPTVHINPGCRLSQCDHLYVFVLGTFSVWCEEVTLPI